MLGVFLWGLVLSGVVRCCFGDCCLCSGIVFFVQGMLSRECCLCLSEELPGILVGGVFVHGVFAIMLFLSGVYCF